MLKSSNVIVDKSFDFAVRIINLYKLLNQKTRDFALTKQFLRSGTSIGANIREAQNAESKKDFVHKLAIAQKEIGETIYWIELLYSTFYINTKEFESLSKDAHELLRIIGSIIISCKKSLT